MEMEILAKFIFSFALILIAARLGGQVAERYLKQPAVIGELVAGIIISPFALGGLIFGNDPILLNFALVGGEGAAFGIREAESFIPVIHFGEEGFKVMGIIAEFAVIVLLFVAGVETDVRSFLRQGKSGALVAIGGVILPFVFGYLITKAFYPDGPSTAWLFMGTVLVATSIGITVRILMDMGKLNTRAGTTILVAAVIDDIIGIVILSVMAKVADPGATVSALYITKITLLGFGVWFVLLMVGVKFHKQISRFVLSPFKSSGTMPIVAVIIGFLIAYLVTLADLHPVVGAYVAGLMFAACGEKEEIIEKLHPIMLFLAPFFFCYLGMQVDVPAMASAWLIAIILIVLAAVGKIIGCYFPAKFVGKLSNRESMVVAVGMVPRGEVGLIIAGVALTIPGALGDADMASQLFGAAVAVSLFTTLITPSMLKPLFKKAKSFM
ncbi:MAG: cation:proton antiporter [Chloroflexota bacterium]|nr:cation:proton antiporter [Chloroflexota bacterium]